MSQQLIARQIKAAKASIMSGNAMNAAKDVDNLMHLLKKFPPEKAAHAALETQLAELRELAQAAVTGARAAAEQMLAILHAARSLETYDKSGQRQVADTGAAQPRRF